MLSVRNLHAGYAGSTVLHGFDLDIEAGKAVALIGRNGMGKTTFIRSLFNLVSVYDGEARFFGSDLRALKPHQIATKGISLAPEGREIFTGLTVEENLIATSRKGRWSLQGVYELFPRLAERRTNWGWQLSGGEQQMLAVGRALLRNPQFLILDEATEGMAPIVADQLWGAIALMRERGQSFLAVDRNLDALLPIVDEFIVVEKGRVIWRGTPAEVRGQRAKVEKFLGVEDAEPGADEQPLPGRAAHAGGDIDAKAGDVSR